MLDAEANRANSDEGEGGSNIDRGRLTTNDDDSSETLCIKETPQAEMRTVKSKKKFKFGHVMTTKFCFFEHGAT